MRATLALLLFVSAATCQAGCEDYWHSCVYCVAKTGDHNEPCYYSSKGCVSSNLVPRHLTHHVAYDRKSCYEMVVTSHKSAVNIFHPSNPLPFDLSAGRSASLSAIPVASLPLAQPPPLGRMNTADRVPTEVPKGLSRSRTFSRAQPITPPHTPKRQSSSRRLLRSLTSTFTTATCSPAKPCQHPECCCRDYSPSEAKLNRVEHNKYGAPVCMNMNACVGMSGACQAATSVGGEFAPPKHIIDVSTYLQPTYGPDQNSCGLFVAIMILNTLDTLFAYRGYFHGMPAHKYLRVADITERNLPTLRAQTASFIQTHKRAILAGSSLDAIRFQQALDSVSSAFSFVDDTAIFECLIKPFITSWAEFIRREHVYVMPPELSMAASQFPDDVVTMWTVDDPFEGQLRAQDLLTFVPVNHAAGISANGAAVGTHWTLLIYDRNSILREFEPFAEKTAGRHVPNPTVYFHDSLPSPDHAAYADNVAQAILHAYSHVDLSA